MLSHLWDDGSIWPKGSLAAGTKVCKRCGCLDGGPRSKRPCEKVRVGPRATPPTEPAPLDLAALREAVDWMSCDVRFDGDIYCHFCGVEAVGVDDARGTTWSLDRPHEDKCPIATLRAHLARLERGVYRYVNSTDTYETLYPSRDEGTLRVLIIPLDGDPT